MSEEVRELPQVGPATNVATFLRALPVRARGTGPAQRWCVALWIMLTSATVAALCSTTDVPFYDYYQWLYQGHVVSVLLFGAGAGTGVAAGTFVLSPVPVPNLAAPVLIGLLNVVLPIEAAGAVFLVLTVVGFAVAFGYLVRTLQRRPTAVEFLGFPWAMGFFLYKGYLSFEFGLAGMFVLVAVLHRSTRRPRTEPRSDPGTATLVAVAGLGLLLYLSHLLAWIMGGLAVVVYALVRARRGDRRAALGLVLCLCPGVALAGWYVLAEHGGTGITLYPSWPDKAIALTETLQFFLRLDPFPPAFPLFWANALLAVGFAALLLVLVDLPRCRRAVATRPVLWLSAVLAVVAVVLPISMVNDLIKPDERFVAPAVLLAIAALPYRPTGRRVPALGAGLAAVVIGLHLVEYIDVGARIGRIDAAIDAYVPDQARVLHLTVASRYGCAPSTGLVTGVPVLKWYAVDHTLEGGPAGVDIEETSLVHARDAARLDTTVLALDVPDLPAGVLTTGFSYPYIEAIACGSDLAEIAQEIAPGYRPVAHGDTYTIFKRH